MGRSYVATVVLKYSEASQERLGREFDIFLETPVAVYGDAEPLARIDKTEDRFWSELPPGLATILWEEWQPWLKDLRSKPNCFETRDELANFQKGKLLEY